MRLAIAAQRRALVAVAVPSRTAGFLSGLKGMISGSSATSKREFPSAAVRDADGDGPDVNKMSGLELSKHQMLKQRALEAEMLAQQQAAGAEDATLISEDFKQSLLSTPMVENEKLDVNADGVQTFRGNEAWAATNRRQLPQAPSKEDLSTRLLGEAGLLDERVPEGMLDAHNVWAFLNEAAELREPHEPADKLEALAARDYRLSGTQAVALLSSHSTVVVLQNETGTKRIGACAVPPSITDGSAAGWTVASEEEHGAGATLTPRQATLDAQSRDDHELTDAQRAARGLGLPPRPSRPPLGGGEGGARGGKGASAAGLPWQRHVDESEFADRSPGTAHAQHQQPVVWDDVTFEMTKSTAGLGLDIGVACDVDAVADGSQASAAGVMVGDIIVGMNHVDVENRESLVSLVSSIGIGETFTLTVLRESFRPQQTKAEGGAAHRLEEEQRAAGVFWEGPQGADYGFGGSAEDEIIAQAAAAEGAWVTESGMVIREVVGGSGE